MCIRDRVKPPPATKSVPAFPMFVMRLVARSMVPPAVNAEIVSVELSKVMPPLRADVPVTVRFPSVPRLVSDEAVTPTPVSYTHLDVYKRQEYSSTK